MGAAAEAAQGVRTRVGRASRFWWLRALLAWMLIALLETAQGIARSLWLVPVVGDVRARQLANLFAPWLAAHWRRVP